MHNQEHLDHINRYISYGTFLAICSLAGISLLWDVYFLKRIQYNIRLYRKFVKVANTDSLVNPEAALHYKVEIYKYVFMLAINVTEITSIVLYRWGICISTINPNYKVISKCSSGIVLNTFLLQVIIANPIAAVFISFAEAVFMLSLSLVICLMKYLDVKYRNINGEPFQHIKRILLFSCVIGIVLVITGSVPQLFIFQKQIYPIILLVYFCFWVKQTRTFYRTLRWKAVEYKVRGMSSDIVRRSVKICCHFRIIMSLMGIGYMNIIFNFFLIGYLFLINTVVQYGPCLFHHLYETHYYKPLLTTPQQIEALNLCNEVVEDITLAGYLVFCLVTALPYVAATVVFFGGILKKKLSYRFGRVRTRFTPSLTDPLLIQ